jgi:hypothetical protein
MAIHVFEELQAARKLLVGPVDTIEHFKVSPLGGAWTAANLGVAFEAYQGKAVGAHVGEFCQRYHLQKAARFDVNLYSPEGSVTMATFWCERMTFFYEYWLDVGSPERFEFLPEHVLLCPEKPSFGEFVLTVTSPKALIRVQQLRDLKPHGDGRLH